MKISMTLSQNSLMQKCCLWLLLITIPFISSAQKMGQEDKKFSRFSILVANGNQTIGFPFQNWFTAFNPSINAGVDFRLNKGEQHAIIAGLTTTLIINSNTGHILAPGLHLKYRYTHKIGCFASLGLEGGSLLQFYPRQGWKYNTETQEYDPQTQIVGASYIGIQLSLGYDFSQQLKQPYAIFLRTKSLLQYPYFNSAFPILPHQLIELGLRIRLSKKSK